jgi:DNA-binding transcriptional ArsR family regulator
MLEGLFGNATAANVLMFLAMNREAYAQEMADALRVDLSTVQGQLRRLERGGVLVGSVRGRMRFYTFNPRFPFTADLTQMLQRAVDFMPEPERERFIARRRPRLTAKPL